PQRDRAPIAHATEAEVLGRRVQDLETRLAEQGRLLVEHENAAFQLRAERDAAQRAAADLRAELGAGGGRRREPADAARAEHARLQAELAKANAERTPLQQDIITTKRQTAQP